MRKFNLLSIVSLLLLTAACSSSVGLLQLHVLQTPGGSGGEVCKKERYFVHSLTQKPGEIGYVDPIAVGKSLSEMNKIVTKKMLSQRRCTINWMELKTLRGSTTEEIIKQISPSLQPQKDILLHYLIAFSHFLNNRLSTSLFILEQLLKEKSTLHRPLLYNLMGIIQYRQTNYLAAAQAFRKAIAASTKELAARFNLAFLSLKGLDGQTAYDQLLFVQKYVKNYEVFLGLGQSALLLGKAHQAEKYLIQAIDSSEINGLAHYYLGFLYANLIKNHDKAKDHLQIVMKNRSDSTIAGKKAEVSKILQSLR